MAPKHSKDGQQKKKKRTQRPHPTTTIVHRTAATPSSPRNSAPPTSNFHNRLSKDTTTSVASNVTANLNNDIFRSQLRNIFSIEN